MGVGSCRNWGISFLVPKFLAFRLQTSAFSREAMLECFIGWIVRVSNKSGIDEKMYHKIQLLASNLQISAFRVNNCGFVLKV